MAQFSDVSNARINLPRLSLARASRSQLIARTSVEEGSRVIEISDSEMKVPRRSLHVFLARFSRCSRAVVSLMRGAVSAYIRVFFFLLACAD